MKHLSIYLSCALAAGLWSCSSDDQPKNDVDTSNDNVYATLSFSFGTRSTTEENPGDNPAQSNDGFEYGKDSENKVSSVLVVLASKGTDGEFTYITNSGIVNATSIPNTTPGAAGTPNPLYRIKFNTAALTAKAGEEVYIFAYCNPSSSLVTTISDLNGWSTDLEGELSDYTNSIWEENNFLMTNALEAPVTLPSEWEMNNVYNKENNPYDMGIVKVERLAARFDFSHTKLSDDLGNDTYPVYESPSEETKVLQGYVTIDGMALFNQAKNFYYLPRVAANTGTGQNASADLTKVTLLGKETSNNWVLSPANKTWDYTLQPTGTPAALPLPSEFTYTSLESLQEDDNNVNWNQDGSKGDYKIWRYTTENTISSVTAQKHGITTGVIFRGEITGKEGTGLATAISSKTPLYVFEGIMYGNLEQLKQYISGNPGSAVSVAFQESWNQEIDVAETQENIYNSIKDVKDLAKSDNQFNVYAPDENGKYYVYYYYFNRHNDNGNNTVMGPMEFATVRNNVYKLRVTNIYQWGNPGDKPTDPGTPDEDPEVYFRVQVEVLPWVVRINNIEF